MSGPELAALEELERVTRWFFANFAVPSHEARTKLGPALDAVLVARRNHPPGPSPAAPVIAELFWTVEQAAAAWSISAALAARLIRERRVPEVQLFAGRFFIPKGTPKPALKVKRRAGPTIELHPEAFNRLKQ